jgi:hypothetical protein
VANEEDNKETIEEGGKENEGVDYWKFCSSEDGEIFSKICWAILHPIMFKGKREKTETPILRKFKYFYVKTESC